MPSKNSKVLTEKTILFIFAFFLAGIERFIPIFPLLPWLKIGLFHAITLIWIIRFGILDALAFIFIRQWVIAAFFGFSFLPFMLGTSASVCSVILGGLLLKTNRFGIIAVAIFSALINNIAQLFALFLMMNGSFIWQWQLPVMAVVSLFTGTITGLLAFEVNKIDFSIYPNNHAAATTICRPLIRPLYILALISVIVSTIIFENYWYYLALFIVIMLISRQNLLKFVKAYYIFIFALFLSSGFSLMQVSKVSIWFLLTPLIQSSGFFTLFYNLLMKFFPKKCNETLSIGAIMPQIFPQILEELPAITKIIFKNPKSVVEILVKKSQEILSAWGK